MPEHEAEEEDLREAARAKKRDWEIRYKYHSDPAMKRRFAAFSEARQDPFNKDPSWRKGVMHTLGKAMAKQGLQPKEFFNKFGTRGDGSLNRAQMKNQLSKMMPGSSDAELLVLIDEMDTNDDGLIDSDELSRAVDLRHPVNQASMERWRNPVHRIARIPPARIDGWEHLNGSSAEAPDTRSIRKSQIATRIAASIPSDSPCALRSHIGNVRPKHHYFNGGYDDDRFRNAARQRQKRDQEGGLQLPALPVIPDPGDSLSPRPGFMVTSGLKALLSPRWS